MGAKTVKDLIAFNASVPNDIKVKVRLQFRNYSATKTQKLYAQFVYAEGENVVMQLSTEREKYYGQSIDKIEKGTEAAIERFEDPTNKPMFPWGSVSCVSNNEKEEFKCNNAWFISLAEVAKGYGPLLYDCLIAKLGQHGYGLTADRHMVSTPAAGVWSFYLSSRPDVTKKLLDVDKSTPPTDDDCYATHNLVPQWNTWIDDPEKMENMTPEQEKEFAKEKAKRESMRKAVNYAYFDNGITALNELSAAGLLIDESEGLNESYALKQLYESFLQDIKKIKF